MKADELAYEIAVAENKIYALYDTDRNAAFAECQRLLGLAPRNLFAHFHIMLIYKEREQWELALSHAQKVKKLNPKEPNIHGNLGDIFRSLGDIVRAIRYFKREVELYPDDWQAHWSLAWLYMHREQWKSALSHFEIVRKLEPRTQSLNLNIGAIYSEMGDDQTAIRFHKRELELYPDCTEALYNLGIIYYKRRRWKTAIKYLQPCFDLRFCIDEIVQCLANCYETTGQIEKEIAVYRAFLEVFPNDGEVLNNLGAALMNLENYEEALIYLYRSQQFGGDHAMTERNIQRTILYSQGKDKEARAIPFE